MHRLQQLLGVVTQLAQQNNAMLQTINQHQQPDTQETAARKVK